MGWRGGGASNWKAVKMIRGEPELLCKKQQQQQQLHNRVEEFFFFFKKLLDFASFPIKIIRLHLSLSVINTK